MYGSSWYFPVSLVGVPPFLQDLTPRAECGHPSGSLTCCPRFFPVSEPPGLHVDGLCLPSATSRRKIPFPRPPEPLSLKQLPGLQDHRPRASQAWAIGDAVGAASRRLDVGGSHSCRVPPGIQRFPHKVRGRG